MLNLKTAKPQTLKAHLDRLQAVLEGLAELAAGETLAGLPDSAKDLNAGVSILLRVKKDLTTQFDRARRVDPKGLELPGSAFIITRMGISRDK
jgi:hypothetical protein